MTNHRGSLLIEVLLSAGILTTLGLVLGGLVSMTSRTTHAAERATQAIDYAKEAMEELVAIKNTDWTQLNPGRYHIIRQPSALQLMPASAPQGLSSGFTRQIDITVGHRDATGRLTDSGPADDNVRQLSVTVAWVDRGQPRQVNLVNYVTNWQPKS